MPLLHESEGSVYHVLFTSSMLRVMSGGGGVVGREANNPKETSAVYEGRLKSSWTHLITPNGNLVEVR
jgi:hypothetical protein